MTRIIGIDPGFDRLGVAVLDKEGSKETLVFSTSLITKRTDPFEDRLLYLANELTTLLTTYTPQECALEALFFTKNQTTAMQVAEIRGVIIYIMKVHNVSLCEYSPPQIKLAVTGYGRASKDDVAHMVRTILKLPPTIKKLDDELDAIAIALTHSSHRKTLAWK